MISNQHILAMTERGPQRPPARSASGRAPAGGAVAEIELVEGHVLAARAELTTKTRRDRRALCGRLPEDAGPGPCSRCRLSLSRLVGHLLRIHGDDAVIQVDGTPWSARVVRAMWPPLLARAMVGVAEPTEGAAGHVWTALRVPGSTFTHIGLARAVIHDPVHDRWISAVDDEPTMTGCLRRGVAAPDAQVDPGVMCAACAAARDRMTERLPGLLGSHGSTSDGHPPSDAPVHELRPGQPVPRSAAGEPPPRAVVASVTIVDGRHVHLARALRPDAVLGAVAQVPKVGVAKVGAATLCNDPRLQESRPPTPTGACARCAQGMSRFAKTLAAQWPQVEPWVSVDGTPVPAAVLGGRRVMLGDAVLLQRAVAVPAGTPRPSDRLELLDGHLVWEQRTEGTSRTGFWTAVTEQDAMPICGADDAAPGVCGECVATATDPTWRRGRYAPDPDATIAISGTVYDLAMAELLGPAFVHEMITADLRTGIEVDAGEVGEDPAAA